MVSVIIVTFNAAATLGESIRSVIGQTYNDKELLIIDGGSTDDTLEVLQSYGNGISYFISEKDEGIYDAMNKGIAAAKGNWVYFLGADDILFDNAVLQNIFGRENNNADVIYGDTLLKSTQTIFGGSRNYHQLIEKNINHQAIFYKKRLLDKIGRYDLSYKVLADYDLNLKIFRDEKLIKEYVPVTVSVFNDKGGTSNVTIDSGFFKDKLFYFRKYDNISSSNPILQQYKFYYGFALLYKRKNISGLKYIFSAFFNGPRKIHYMLVFIKFSAGIFGIGKKIKIG